MRQETAILLTLVSLQATPIAHAQTKPTPHDSQASSQAALLVDTDDACRLTVDGNDEGVITPEASKKIKVSAGEHVVKCVIENVPDLVWRKVVQVKNSEQAAALVALKALHLEYDQALGKSQEQQEQMVAKEKQREKDVAEAPQRLFTLLQGVWRWTEHDPDLNWRSEGQEGPYPQDFELIVNFQNLNNRTIATLITYSIHTSAPGGKTGSDNHEAYSGSFALSPPNLLTQDGEFPCEFTRTRSVGGRQSTDSKKPCASLRNIKVQIQDANHLALTGVKSSPVVLTR